MYELIKSFTRERRSCAGPKSMRHTETSAKLQRRLGLSIEPRTKHVVGYLAPTSAGTPGQALFAQTMFGPMATALAIASRTSQLSRHTSKRVVDTVARLCVGWQNN